MSSTFHATLRKIRKEKGITQEQLADAVGVSAQAVSKWEMSSYPDTQLLPSIADFLGVTIDALFGRTQDDLSMNDRVLRYFNSLPQEERFQAGLDICRALTYSCCGVDEYYSLPTQILAGEDFDNYSQVTWESGWLQSRNNGNLPYFLLMPEPECGYDKVLSYDENMVGLFSFLSTPNALRAMYYLAEQKSGIMFTEKALCHELKISHDNAKLILDGMLSFHLIYQNTLNKGDSSEPIYHYLADCNFISFLLFTRTLLYRPHGFTFQTNNRSEPYFKNQTYKADLQKKV